MSTSIRYVLRETLCLRQRRQRNRDLWLCYWYRHFFSAYQ